MHILNIFGFGGHGKVVKDIASQKNYNIINFFDDNLTVNVLGDFSDLLKYNLDNKCDNFIAIGNNELRRNKINILINNNFKIVNLIDESVNIASDIMFGNGIVIMPGCNINNNVKIGDGCIINTGSNIDHHCIIEEFSHISPGCTLCGNVNIGSNVWLGSGSTVINNISIGSNAIIGSGSTIFKNINENLKIITKIDYIEEDISLNNYE